LKIKVQIVAKRRGTADTTATANEIKKSPEIRALVGFLIISVEKLL